VDSKYSSFTRRFECSILPEGILQGSLALEQNLIGIVHFLVCVKWHQNFSYFLEMAENGDRFQDLSTRMDTVEGEISAI